MGRPVKIRKKKSFMFTTKHYSFTSILGLLIAIGTLGIIITIVMYSYKQAGNIPVKFGMFGITLVLLNLIGVIAGAISVNERDTYKSPAIAAVASNGVMLVMWMVILFLANK